MTELLAPPAPLLITTILPPVLGLIAWRLGWVRRSGFFAGVPVGVFILATGGLAGFAVLLGFFLLGTALTRFGYAQKDAQGVAEAEGGRRGASHALANCGTGLLLLGGHALARAFGWAGGVADPGSPPSPIFWAAFVGAFAAAASDTSSSELGQLYGRSPVSPRSLRRVPVGTEGAVSIEGLLAGVGAAVVLALLGGALGMYDARGILAVAAGGFFGNFLESLVGASGRRLLPHGGLNFANTVVGAAASAGVLRILGF